MTLVKMSGTNLYVGQILPNTLMLAILNLLFFLIHMSALSHYQTIPLLYLSIFHNYLTCIFFLKTSVDRLKTSSRNPLFQKFLLYFQKRHHRLKLHQIFFLQKLAKELPKLFVLKHTNRASFQSLI